MTDNSPYPIETIHTDALGTPLAVGDIGIYATSGRYSNHSIVQVLELRKRVRVNVIHGNLPKGHTMWTSGHTMYLIEKLKDNPNSDFELPTLNE